MGYYNLPSTEEELEQDLNRIEEEFFQDYAERLKRLYVIYRGILSGDIENIDDETCRELAFFEKQMNAGSESLSEDELKEKYRNMSMDMVLEHITTYWRVVMWQTNSKYESHGIKNDYAMINENSNDVGKSAAKDLKFSMWQMELLQNYKLFTAQQQDFSSLIDNLRLLATMDETSFKAYKDNNMLAGVVKGIEKIFSVPMEDDTVNKIIASLGDIKSYFRNRLQDMANRVTEGTNIPTYVHIQNLSEELPELDKDLVSWKENHREKLEDENMEESKEDEEYEEDEKDEENKDENNQQQLEEIPKGNEVKQIYDGFDRYIKEYPVLKLDEEDSPLMRKVKDAIRDCNNKMGEKINTERPVDDYGKIYELEASIVKAFNACRKYCSKRMPIGDRGVKRWEAVNRTKEMLKEQYRQLETVWRFIETERKNFEKAEAARRENGVVAEAVDNKYQAGAGSTDIKNLMGYVKHTEDERLKRMPRIINPVDNLTYEDFVEVISPWNSDYVELHEGKLRTATNVLNSVNWWQKPKMSNWEIREKLAKLALDREIKSRNIRGIESNESYKKARLEFYREKLDVHDRSKVGRPIPMKKLREFIEFVDLRCSMVNTILSNINMSIANEVRIAKAVKASMEVEENAENIDFYERKRNQVKKLHEIITAGKNQGINLKISEKRVEELATGHMLAIGDIAYSLINESKRCSENFNKQNKENRFEIRDGFEKDENFRAKVLTYAVKIEAAATKAEKDRVRLEAKNYCWKYAFKEAGKPELFDLVNKYKFPELYSGVAGLRKYAVDNFSSIKEWKGKEKEVASGIVALEKLCNYIKVYQDQMEDCCINGRGGINDSKLRKAGDQIEHILNDQQFNVYINDAKLVLLGIEDSHFRASVQQLIDKHQKGEINFVTDYMELALACRKQTIVKNQEDEIEEDDKENVKEKLKLLQKNSKNVAEIISLKSIASGFIKDNQIKAEEIGQLYNDLKLLKNEGNISRNLNIGQATVEFGKNKNGCVWFSIDGIYFNTGYTPDNISSRLEEDMWNHVDVYGLETFKKFFMESITNAVVGEERVPSTERMLGFLHQMTKVNKDRLRKYSDEELIISVYMVLNGQLKSEREVIDDLVERTKGQYEKRLLDRNVASSVKALEEAAKNKSLQSKIMFSAEFDKQPAETDEVTWNEQEKAIKDLIADLVWPSDAWKNEVINRNDPADRIRHTIYKHADTIAMLIQNEGLAEQVVEKLGIKKLNIEGLDINKILYGDKDEPGILKNLTLDGLLDKDMPSVKELLKTCDPQDLSDIVKGLVGNYDDALKASEIIMHFAEHIGITKLIDEFSVKHMDVILQMQDDMRNPKELTDAERKEAVEKLKNDVTSKMSAGDIVAFAGAKDFVQEQKLNVYYDLLGQIRQILKINTSLATVDSYIGNVVHEGIMPSLQSSIKESLNKNMFNEDEDVFVDVGDLEISDMLMNNITGESGQGLFFKKILQGYFDGAEIMQQREMLASALRELKPSQITDDNIEEDKKNALLELQLGSFMSGLFKGAGPLLHKTLQGFPTKDLSLGMKNAMDDMKSHLSSIPKELIAAQMNHIIDASNGAIKSIEIKESLGAASVGEAFLCKIYGDQIGKNGREVVIKLLRPDVRSRMRLDKGFFMKCAAETNDGMRKTFANQMKVYEDETDLTLEANNIEQGKVYNEGDDRVKSENLVGAIEKSGNYLALEKANGETVGSYFKRMQQKQQDVIKQYDTDQQELALLEILNADANELFTRQQFLIELAKKWVTEAFFRKGFYQADLHKDNIMISNYEVTVIDYGNATTLSQDQKEAITHMIACATLGISSGFAENYEKLLSEESKATYTKQKKAEFIGMISSVFEKKGDIGSKIAVVLMEAQKMGLELPTAVYNFSQGQMRLQNTIDDGNELIKNYVTKIDKLMKKHWEKDDKSIFYALKQIYLDNPTKNTIEAEINTKLGFTSGRESDEEKAKQEETKIEWCNKIFNSDGIEIQQLIRLYTQLGRQYDEIREYLLGDGNKNFPFTKEILSKDSKLKGKLSQFLSAVSIALNREAGLYKDAKELIKKMEDPEDFISAMGSVVEEHRNEALQLVGKGKAVMYAANAEIYQNAPEKWEEKEKKIKVEDIVNLMHLCNRIKAIPDEVVNKKISAQKPMDNASKELARTSIRDIASYLRLIPDVVLPQQSKKYIIKRLNLFDETKAIKDFKQNPNGASKENQKDIDWIDTKKEEDFLKQSYDKEKLYDFRNALRLVRGYLERMLKTKTAQLISAEQKMEIDKVLEGSLATVDTLKNEITPEEFKRILTERQKAKKAANNIANEIDNPANNVAEEVRPPENKKTNKLDIQQLTTELKDILSERKFSREDLPSDEPFIKGIDNILKINTIEEAMENSVEYYPEYDKYIYKGGKLDEEMLKRLNSNDITVLTKLRDEKETKIRLRLKQHLDYRIKKLKEMDLKALERAEKGEISKPAGKFEMTDKKYSLNNAAQKITQDTFYGSWSVALATLLSYRGVELDPSDIRAYRPDANFYSADDLALANKDASNDLAHYTDLIQKFLPTTMVNKVVCDKEMSIDTAQQMLSKCILNAFTCGNSPLALLYGGHYCTIHSIEGKKVSYYDTDSKSEKTIDLEDLVKQFAYTYIDDEGQVRTKYKFTAEWFEDIKFNLHNEPELGGELIASGASYLDNELTHANSQCTNATKYKGYKSGDIEGEPILSLLPTSIKVKNEMYNGFNMSAFDNIAKKAADESQVNEEVKKTLKEHPKGFFWSLFSSTWISNLQKMYQQKDTYKDIDRTYIDYALEEVRRGYLVGKKKQLMDEINKNLRSINGDIVYLDNNDKAIKMREIIEKAMYIHYVESLDLHEKSWLEKAGKDPFFGEDEKKQLEAQGMKKLLDEMKISSDLMAEVRIKDTEIPVEKKVCSEDILYVKLLTDIEKGKFPEQKTLKNMLARANDKLVKLQEKVKAQQADLAKNPGIEALEGGKDNIKLTGSHAKHPEGDKAKEPEKSDKAVHLN